MLSKWGVSYLQSFNANEHQPCSCTALDFCTARGLQPIRTRPAVSSINHPWLHYYFPFTTFVQCESCLLHCFDFSICSLLKPCRIVQNGQTFAIFLSSLPSLRCTCSSTIQPCLASAHIWSRYGRSRYVLWTQLAAAWYSSSPPSSSPVKSLQPQQRRRLWGKFCSSATTKSS